MGRAPCCDKNTGIKRGPWTPEEDEKLIQHIHKHGYGNWRTLPKNAGLQRCGKSCRLRWTNYLRPDIKRGRFSFDEEETIIKLHSVLGNKWSAIAGRLPGRTDNEIKNHWNTHIRKRLLRMGIDPVTHAPRLDLLENNLNISSLLGIHPHLLTLATHFLSTQYQNYLPQENPIQYLPNQFESIQAPEEVLNAGNFGWENSGWEKTAKDEIFDYEGFDPSSTCEFKFNGCEGFGMVSPSASGLNSNSTYFSGGGGTEEDERESYCSDMLKFQIPDLLNVNDFM